MRAGDSKKKSGADGVSLVSCGKVCDNVSAAPRHVRMAMFFTLRFQVLSAVSNAALDDAFACAVMGKKVCEGRGARCDSCSCSRALLSQSGAIHEKICAIVQSIAPAQQQQQQQKSDDALQPVLAAIAEHAVLALSRLLKAAAAATPPALLLSAPILASLVHVVSGGTGGGRLSVIGGHSGHGFVRSAGLLDAGWGLGVDLRGDVCVRGCVAAVAILRIACMMISAATLP